MGPKIVGLTTRAEEGVILLTSSLEPIAFDAGAAALMKDHGQQRGRQDSAFCIPEEILSLLRRRKHGNGTCERMSARIGSHQYICRIYAMRSAAQPMLLLHLQRDIAAMDAVYRLAKEYVLTDREKEALLGLALGLSSKEVAERMSISPNTVKAYVRLIMIKMGVTRRSAIVGKLLEYNGGVTGGLNGPVNGAAHRQSETA